jgi:hypothetical protein
VDAQSPPPAELVAHAIEQQVEALVQAAPV